MKIRIILISLIGALLCVPFGMNAQEEEKNQMYWVHEDVVKPSMLAEYERTSKELATKAKTHNIGGEGWITTQTSDMRYMYVSPIESMSDVNYEEFTVLQEKMGSEAFNNLFADMDKCYSRHMDYVIVLDKALTYMPEGITQTPEGKNYRKFWYLHTEPEHTNALWKKMKEIKDMYAAKGSTSYYRVYRSGFGTPGTYFMVAVAAENPVAFETQGEANQKLLGEEAQALFTEAMKYITEIEEVTANMRPDLAYNPSN